VKYDKRPRPPTGRRLAEPSRERARLALRAGGDQQPIVGLHDGIEMPMQHCGEICGPFVERQIAAENRTMQHGMRSGQACAHLVACIFANKHDEVPAALLRRTLQAERLAIAMPQHAAEAMVEGDNAHAHGNCPFATECSDIAVGDIVLTRVGPSLPDRSNRSKIHTGLKRRIRRLDATI
jgi:hypothetical protein